jgi:hypothetical protein
MSFKKLSLAAVFLLFAFSAVDAKISFAGGDGSSIGKAIRIIGARGEMHGVHSEYVWLKRNRPGCALRGQSLSSVGRQKFDEMRISCGGQVQAVYFDITAYFGKF